MRPRSDKNNYVPKVGPIGTAKTKNKNAFSFSLFLLSPTNWVRENKNPFLFSNMMPPSNRYCENQEGDRDLDRIPGIGLKRQLSFPTVPLSVCHVTFASSLSTILDIPWINFIGDTLDEGLCFKGLQISNFCQSSISTITGGLNFICTIVFAIFIFPHAIV